MSTNILVFVYFVTVSSALQVFNYTQCKRESFSSDSFVCVCTESYCDGFDNEKSQKLTKGTYGVYTSSKDSARLKLTLGKFSPRSDSWKGNDHVELYVDSLVKYQKIFGFGGAFTDAATMNIKNLSEALQEHLLNSYFSSKGVEYSIGRIPMASCDFSTHIYTYADVPGDFNMSHFNLATEDTNFKIPIIKSAMRRSQREIKLFGSPWSAPGWMKTSKSTVTGELIGNAGNKYHKAWALYFVKFLEAYQKNGLKLWGLTVQNEPSTGYFPRYKFQSMGFKGPTERDFVKSDLGPALKEAGYGDTSLMIFDDNRLTLPIFPYQVLKDSDAAKYVSGVAVHWYEDAFLPASFLSDLHEKYPDFYILATEACTGALPYEVRGPVLGSWHRGERYSSSIIQDMNNWATGWTDWNLALNMIGGPNWVKNFVDSPIIVNSEKQVFYKQPMFFHLGHFSKFVLPGSIRIDVKLTSAKSGVEYIGFLLPDGSICVIVLNKSKNSVKITIHSKMGFINSEIPASSIQTYLWSEN